MEQYPDGDRAAQNLLRNRLELGQKLGIVETAHTPPASHYPHIYLWDSCFAAIINARAGGRRWVQAAHNEVMALTTGQRTDGFIPNMQFADKGRGLDPERWLAFGRKAEGSNYTQPPVLSLAVAETYESMASRPAEQQSFLQAAYPKVKHFYEYFDRERRNSSDDPLIGVIHPHETGRDSDPTFDFIKPLRLPRKGVDTARLVDKANIAIDYFSIIAHGIKLRSVAGNVAQAREVFWVNDIMMNCIYADNLYHMADLADLAGEPEDHVYFSELARSVEERVLTSMWFVDPRKESTGFYALDAQGGPIDRVSVSNLFPLVMPHLREEQLESVLDLMDRSFDTPYPLPSVATNSPNYDPHNQESDRLWRGPTWINMNWYLGERGLKRQLNRIDLGQRPDLQQRCEQWTEKIVLSSHKLLELNGPLEHYDPVTGAGQRRRVKNFAWSNLGYVMLLPETIYPEG